MDYFVLPASKWRKKQKTNQLKGINFKKKCANEKDKKTESLTQRAFD